MLTHNRHAMITVCYTSHGLVISKDSSFQHSTENRIVGVIESNYDVMHISTSFLKIIIGCSDVHHHYRTTINC